MSFPIGDGYDPENLYVGLVGEADGNILLDQTRLSDGALIRIMWDTRQ
jgi:hypothetical protein